MRKFNLSLDDFSPREGTNDLYWVNKLIEEYSDIKIDLFMSAAYCRLGEDPYYLSKNIEWVNWAKQLSKNYKICLHGLYHRRSKKDFAWHNGIESNNNEWENLTYDQAKIVLDVVDKEFKKVDLEYSKVFRPPGWHIGYGALRLLKERGFVIAGNQNYYLKFKDRFENLKWVSENWDLIGPYAGADTDIFGYAHVSEWCPNFFDKTRYDMTIKILNSDNFEFISLSEIF